MPCECLEHAASRDTSKAPSSLCRLPWLGSIAFPAGAFRISWSKMFLIMWLGSSLWNEWSSTRWLRPSNRLVHRTEGECYLSFMVVLFVSLFSSTLVFLFIMLRQVFCPRATCPLRPPECWPALEIPEADQHLRYPYGHDSAGWTPVTGVGRGLLPSLLFSWTRLEKRGSTLLAACMVPLAQMINSFPWAEPEVWFQGPLGKERRTQILSLALTHPSHHHSPTVSLVMLWQSSPRGEECTFDITKILFYFSYRILRGVARLSIK